MSFNVFEASAQWGRSNHIHTFTFDEITSTNDLAKKEAFFHHSEFVLYLASHQTQGRGRFQRQWVENAAGTSLLSSWSFKIEQSPSPVLTARIGLAVVESFAKAFPNSLWSLKAPNDVFLNGKKVGGILTEIVSQGTKHRLIIGLGVNVLENPAQVPESTFIEADTKVNEVAWNLLLENLKIRFSNLSHSAHNPTLTEWERSELLYWLNRNPNLSASYSAVDPDGSLTYDDKKIFWMEL